MLNRNAEQRSPSVQVGTQVGECVAKTVTNVDRRSIAVMTHDENTAFAATDQEKKRSETKIQCQRKLAEIDVRYNQSMNETKMESERLLAEINVRYNQSMNETKMESKRSLTEIHVRHNQSMNETKIRFDRSVAKIGLDFRNSVDQHRGSDEEMSN
jgi:DNA anti-recombination protein RmuC